MQELILMKTCHILTSLKPEYVINLLKEWQASINSMSKVNYYVKYKKTFEFEPYLNSISNYMISNYSTCFGQGSHRLEIELGRITGIDRENRCKLCNSNVETEYHVLMCCPKDSNIRSKYLHTVWPSINKFVSFVSSKNVNVLNNLSKFIFELQTVRDLALQLFVLMFIRNFGVRLYCIFVLFVCVFLFIFPQLRFVNLQKNSFISSVHVYMCMAKGK